MTVLVTGSSGLVGSALIPNLEAGGHRVFRLVRQSPQGDTERPVGSGNGRTRRRRP